MSAAETDSPASDVFFIPPKIDTIDYVPHVSSRHVPAEGHQNSTQTHVKSVQKVDFHPHLPVVNTSFEPSAISRTISSCWTYKRHGTSIQGTIWKNADAEKRMIAGGDEKLREKLRSSPHFEYFHISSDGSKTYIVNQATQVSLSQVLSTHLIKLGKSYQSDWIVNIVGQLLSVLKYLGKFKIKHGSLNPKTIEFTSAGQMKIVQYGRYTSCNVRESNFDWQSAQKILDKCVQQVLSNPDSSNFWKKVSKAASLKDFLKLEQHKFLSQMPKEPSGQLQQLIRLTPWHFDQKYPVPAP